MTLQYIDPFNTGKLVLFEVTTSQVLREFELIPWAFLGVCGGLWGAWFIHLNEEWERFRRASGLHRWPVTEVAALALFTSVVSYLVIFMRIPSSELVVNLFQDCSAVDTYGLCECVPPFPPLLQRDLIVSPPTTAQAKPKHSSPSFSLLPSSKRS